MTETQEREQKIYGYFQQKAQNGGITSEEFCRWVSDNMSADIGRNYDSESRFKRMVKEFAEIIIKEKLGNRKMRYHINPDMEDSLYLRHFKIAHIINNAIGNNAIRIRYKMFPPKKDEKEIIFHPEYKRIYNGHSYIYGKAYDDENLYNIPDDCSTDTFTQLNIDRITSVEILLKKQVKFQNTFKFLSDWEKRFEYVLGVDPIQPREPIDLLLYVKDSFKERFKNEPLFKFVVLEVPSDKNCYALFSLKIKQNKELERKLLSYGNDVLVASPQTIKTVIAKEIKKLNEYYNE